MKEFQFQSQHQNWDRFKSFHCNYHPFVEFSNGELAIIGVPEPHERKMYERYNVQLISTTDTELPPLYLNEHTREADERIPKAWLTFGGQQLLAIDWEQGVATAIGYGGYGYWHGRKNTDRPRAFHNGVPDNMQHQVFVYWAGSGRLPVAVRDIKVNMLEKEPTKLIRDKVNEAMPALTAIYRMKPQEQVRRFGTSKLGMRREWLELTNQELVAELSKDNHTLACAVRSGFEAVRSLTETQHLYVKI